MDIQFSGSGNPLNVDGTNYALYPGYLGVTNATGTAVDFTGIPSWVRKVTVMFQGVSTNGASGIIIQLGTSGGYLTSGYLGHVDDLGTSGGTTLSNGFRCSDDTITAADTRHMVANLYNMTGTGNIWLFTVSGGYSNQAVITTGGGSVTLGSTLTSLRITTVGGTNSFDTGTINVMYE